jgi:hypothetical protein
MLFWTSKNIRGWIMHFQEAILLPETPLRLEEMSENQFFSRKE